MGYVPPSQRVLALARGARMPAHSTAEATEIAALTLAAHGPAARVEAERARTAYLAYRYGSDCCSDCVIMPAVILLGMFKDLLDYAYGDNITTPGSSFRSSTARQATDDLP